MSEVYESVIPIGGLTVMKDDRCCGDRWAESRRVEERKCGVHVYGGINLLEPVRQKAFQSQNYLEMIQHVHDSHS